MPADRDERFESLPRKFRVMIETPRTRLVAAGIWLLLLGGLFVAHGTIDHGDATNRYPTNGDLYESGDALEGDRVVLGGTIADVDPVVFEGDAYGDTVRVTLVGLDRDVSPGDDVWLLATVESGDSVAVERAIVREPWEIRYMYVVSVVAGLWVLGRFLRGWRFDPREIAFVPRGAEGYGSTDPDGATEREGSR